MGAVPRPRGDPTEGLLDADVTAMDVPRPAREDQRRASLTLRKLSRRATAMPSTTILPSTEKKKGVDPQSIRLGGHLARLADVRTTHKEIRRQASAQFGGWANLDAFGRIVQAEEANRSQRPPAPPPPSRARTAVQTLLDSLPDTSARMIGNHAIVRVPPELGLSQRKAWKAKRESQPLTPLQQLAAAKPTITSGEFGEFTLWSGPRNDEISDASRYSRSLRKRRQLVKRDPQLADALVALRARVAKLDSRRIRPSDANRVLRGQ